MKGVPQAETLSPDAGPLARLGILGVAPEISDFWQIAADALARFGQPLGYEPGPHGGTLRAQRAVLRLHDGVVRLAPAGDHFKQARMIPAAYAAPVAPPRIPRPSVEAHNLLVTSVAFDPSGTQFATGGFDRKVVIWDRGDLDARLRAGRPLRRHLRSRLLARRFGACQCFRG